MAKILSTVSSTSHAAQSVMARILATENIRVVIDPKMNTAAFDLKNRTLLLPQWKDMSKPVYDMLIGHEISHALHTPATGWRETCNKISGCEDHTSQAWQTASLYLNIVEDARIERLIQVKFPGFRRDFVAAYNELNDKNFFGVKGENLNSLGFADRLNLYYKLGTIGSVGISFTAEEDEFIRRIDNATSFADAAQIAEDLFKFCNEQKHKQSQQQGNNGSGSQSQGPQQGPTNANGKNQSKQSKQSNDQGSDSDTDNTPDKGGNVGGDEQRPGDGSDAQDGDNGQDNSKQQADSKEQSNQPAPVGQSHSNSDAPPAPVTQKNFNRNIENQVQRDAYSTKVDAPTALVHCNIDNTVIDCKKIVELARLDCAWLYGDMSSIHTASLDNYKKIVATTHKMQSDFAKESKKQVDLLMKQFELRKAAQIAKRESIRKTGVLDTVRMVNYKHSEDIFRRNIMLPEGKNHGLVMFVDWSGSMDVCLPAVVEQLMVLVEFCRRVGIPYEVFAFTTRNFTDGTDSNICADPVAARKKMWMGKTVHGYERDSNDQVMAAGAESPATHPEFALLNILSSRLSRTEHTDMIHFLRAFVSRKSADRHDLYFSLPSRWELSGTALDETIVAAMQIVPAFKAANKLDIVNTVFLTDGETSVPYINGEQLIDPATKAVYSAEQFINRDGLSGRSYRDHSYSTNVLLIALRDITKSNVVGMYLTGSSSCIAIDRWFRKEFERQTNILMGGKSIKDLYARNAAQHGARVAMKKSLAKQFNEDNCVVAEPGTTGYSEFFIIKSTTRVLGDESDPMRSVQAGDSHIAVKKAFLKSFENKNKSRVLINRFMELIAR